MKTLKTLLKKHQSIHSPEFVRALIELRNTPSVHGKSPAEMCRGTKLRSMIPDISTPTPLSLIHI